MSRARALTLFIFAALFGLPEAAAAHGSPIVWHPAKPRAGDVAWVYVKGAADDATIEGSLAGRPFGFFPYGGGHAALVGFDVDIKPGPMPWRVAVIVPGREPQTAQGRVTVQRRQFPVQRLMLPPPMVDLDPATEQRALAEGDRLRTLYRTITPERLWRGRFTRPIGGTDPGSGFGARRIINGQPRAPHTGVDYSAPVGTPVVAANDGRVALVAEYFFPGRLVVIDHGLGLYTLYFHLDEVKVAGGEPVSRGQTIGTVGATGRSTGPHLHFGVQVGAARVDPATLLELTFRD